MTIGSQGQPDAPAEAAPAVRSWGRVPGMRDVNIVLAARRFFLDRASKSEIAVELGISRFRVARLLDEAVRLGIVHIEVDELPEIDDGLSREVARRHGIRSALVVRTAGPDEARRGQLGRACAAMLAETLEPTDVLGISWGRTLHSMVDHLAALPPCTVVQVVGGVPSLELDVNSMELVRRVAERTGGAVYPLHAPIVVSTPEMAAGLREDPHVGRTIAMFDRLTKAVVGVGSWRDGGSSLRAGLSPILVQELDAAGAVADVCATVLDGEGRVVEAGGFGERSIAIAPDQLRRVPDVVAIAGGAAKADAIRAVLKSGLIHRLITDEEAARLLIDA